MFPTMSASSVVYDTASGDRVSTLATAPPAPEGLTFWASRPLTDGYSAAVTFSGFDTLVVGQNDAAGRLGTYVQGVSTGSASGTITVDELSRDATGALSSFSASFDTISDLGTGKAIRGVVRWHSLLPYTALQLTSPFVDARLAEVGQSVIRPVGVTNVGNAAAVVWPPSFAGSAAGDWSAAGSSTCDDVSALAPAATCVIDVKFAPGAGGVRNATMSIPSPEGPGAYDVSLTGIGIGMPTPPTNVQANGSVFGAVVSWDLPTNGGGAESVSATIEKTTDNGLTWARIGTVTGADIDSRSYADGLGVAPGERAGYRVSITQAKVAPGQTTTYTSEPSAVAVAIGARQSLVIDAVSGYGDSRVNLRGSMNLDVLTPGFFLPVTDSGPWDESPDGSEIVMASTGANTAALPYQLRRRPALGRTIAGTPIYAGAFPITEVAWSPDGATLAWREYHRDNSTEYLMVGSATGGGVRPLDLSNFWDFQWMPDSRTLVGVSNTPNAGMVTFLDTRTGKLTVTSIPASYIALAPDAQRLVTASYDAGLQHDVFDNYTLDPNARTLTAPVRSLKLYIPISHVEFSPDGRELLTTGGYVPFQRWPLTTDGRVLEPRPSSNSLSPYRISWHSYRPSLAPSPATTGAIATFTTRPGQMAPGTTFRCSVDNKALAGCSTTWTTASLAPGRHTVRVVGTEPNGRSAATARTWVVTAPTLYTAVNPRRVMDTRAGIGAAKAKVRAGGLVTLTVPGLPAGATAAKLNVTATSPTAASHLTAFPSGTVRPNASNLNFVAGQTVANLVVVAVGSGGKVTFFNAAGTVDVVVDLAGYYTPSAGARFIAHEPDRILDTRIGLGAAKAKVGPGTVTFVVPGLRAGATAVALNVTVTRPTAAGFLTAFPTGRARPTASNLNFVKGQTVANMVVVPVGTGGKVSFYKNAGTVDIVADIAGEYSPAAGTTGALFTALAPTRVLDTRNGTGAPTAKIRPGSDVNLTLPDLPDGVTAIALSVTATRGTTPSHLTVSPGPLSGPPGVVSNLNFLAGQSVPNLVIVKVGPNNTVTFSTGAGSVDVIADLAGYFKP
jgi:WD40 repeat protein